MNSTKAFKGAGYKSSNAFNKTSELLGTLFTVLQDATVAAKKVTASAEFIGSLLSLFYTTIRCFIHCVKEYLTPLYIIRHHWQRQKSFFTITESIIQVQYQRIQKKLYSVFFSLPNREDPI